LVELPVGGPVAGIFDACRKSQPATCRYGGVEWVRIDGLDVWADRACLRAAPPAPGPR
jgi:hypothetical protein